MKLAVVGVGSAGSRIVNRILEYERVSGRNLTNGNTLLVTANEPTFDTTEYVPEDRRLTLGDVPWEVDAAGIDADPDLAASVAREERNDLNRAYDLLEFHQVDGILVVAGLAGGTGGGAGAVVIDQLQRICDVPVYAVGVLPGEAEGQAPALNAARALQSFVAVADNVVGFDNDWWCGARGDDATQADTPDGSTPGGVATEAAEASPDTDEDAGSVDGGFDWGAEPRDEGEPSGGNPDVAEDDADSDTAGDIVEGDADTDDADSDASDEGETNSDGDRVGSETAADDAGPVGGDVHVDSVDGDTYAPVNVALAERVVTLFAAGEFRDTDGSEYRLDSSDIIRTLDTGGVSTIGYASMEVSRPGGVRSWLRSIRERLPWTPDPEPVEGEGETGAARVDELVRRAARSDLTLPCDIASADRALISFAGPSRELSRKGFESGRYWLEGEADVVDVMAGDAPHERADTLAAVVLFSNVTDVPRIDEMQETAVGDQNDRNDQHHPSAEGRTYGTANPS